MPSVLYSLWLFVGLAAATCYQLDGKEYSPIRADDGTWEPCDPTAKVSSCCSQKDFCMGNGLCLDAGANNFFSIQGCTDQNWGAPCVTAPSCKSNIKAGYSFIWVCGQKTDSDFNYCCGESAACCSNSTSLFSMKSTTQIYRANTTGSTAGPPSPTGSNPGTNPSQTGNSTPASTQDDSKLMGIALGVGLGVGVPLIAALVFFGWQFRKSRLESVRPMSMVSEPYQPAPSPYPPKANTPSTPGPPYYYQPLEGSTHPSYPQGSPELDSHQAARLQPQELQ